MTISIDATTAQATKTSATWSTVHAGGASPEGVVVMAVRYDSGALTATATYNGVSMTELPGSPLRHVGAGFNDFVIVAFRLDSPASGTQTATVTWSADTGFSGTQIVQTYNSDTAGIQIQDEETAESSGSSANPSGSLALGGNTCAVLTAWANGNAAVGDATPLSGWTSAAETDPGNQINGAYTYDTVGSANVTTGYTAASAEWAMYSIAVTELGATGGGSYRYRRRGMNKTLLTM